MRRDGLKSFCDLEALGVRRHDECRHPLGARSLARARKNSVHVGDPAIGDPGLLTVQHVVIDVQRSAHGVGRYVRPASRLGQR